VKLLERLKNREVSPDYTYYGIASPWLQVNKPQASLAVPHSLSGSHILRRTSHHAVLCSVCLQMTFDFSLCVTCKAGRVHSLDDICVHVQVKCLRVLQYFPVPDDPVVSKGLENVLKRIITGDST